MICKIDTSYHDKVIWLIKVENGTLLGTIIFYNKLSKHLNNHRSIQNEYDVCTFNKIVNSEQVIAQFHVDDLKVSHKDPAILNDFLDELRSEFG